MSGRKVVVTLTQHEAQSLIWAHGSLLDANGGHPDWRAFDRAVDKLQHQLAAVRGKPATEGKV